jgi:hypothetical protein
VKYPHVIKRQELAGGKLVEMINEGPTFGVIQLFIYIDGVQFGPSRDNRERADEIFDEAVKEASR